jgi:DNA processing protein
VIEACDLCLRRAWLLGRLAGRLEPERSRVTEALALDDERLIAAVGGRQRDALMREYDVADVDEQRRRYAAAGITGLCRCNRRFPPQLLDLDAPPAVLHIAGGEIELIRAMDPPIVAIVGARRASGYGLEVARSLARGLTSAGVTVVSGMAYGIDSAAHDGALAVGPTVAVLPGGAERPYPAGRRALYRRIVASGAALSELPPGTSVRRWMFAARNRITAALAAMTVVVEAGERSGSLVTASLARELGRPLGAVPGRVTSPLADGPHQLLAAGAMLIRGPEDVLDELFGADAPRPRAALRPPLTPLLASVLNSLREERTADEAIARAGVGAGEGLAALSSLELGGYIRREPGGRFTVLVP